MLNINYSEVKLKLTYLICCVSLLSFFNPNTSAEEASLNVSAKETNQEQHESKILETFKIWLDGFTVGDTHLFPYGTLADWFDPYIGLKVQHTSPWNSDDRMNHHLKFEDARDYSWKFRYLANSLSKENRQLSFLFKLKEDRDTFFYGIGNSTRESERIPATYSSVFFGEELRQNITDNIAFLWSPGFWKFQSSLVEGGEFEEANDAQYITSRFTLSDIKSLYFLKAAFDNQWSAFSEIGLSIDSSVSSYALFNLQSMIQLPLFKNTRFRIETQFEYLIASDRNLVPYFAMPEIGSKNGLRGFSKERFRNFANVALNFEYAWPFSDKLDGFLLFDVARTAKNPAELLNEDSHTSLGVGIRLRNINHPISLGFVGSREKFKVFSSIDIGSPW